MANLNIIGDRVRRMRESRNITQDQLSAACQRRGWDLSRVTLTKVETGVRVVNDGEIVVLAAVLKCTPGNLLDGLKVPQAVTVVRQGKSGKG